MPTVDITDLVTKVQEVWIDVMVRLVVEAAASVPALSWLNLPVIKPFFEMVVSWIVTAIAKTIEMQAFFLHTTIRKAGQSRDFIQAVTELRSLPKTATREEFENAELKQMDAFRTFVRVTQ